MARMSSKGPCYVGQTRRTTEGAVIGYYDILGYKPNQIDGLCTVRKWDVMIRTAPRMG